MPTNKNVLINREKYIGSSEISTILGINQFKTRFDLLLEKCQLKEPETVDNPYVDFGNEIEKYIRNYLNEKYTDEPFKEDTIIKEEEVIDLRCNYDGLNSTTAVEIKSTSKIHNEIREYKYYVVQLLYGMMLGKRNNGILAVYRRNENFEVNFEKERLQVFKININDFKDWVEEIERAIIKFKEDIMKVKKNPFLTEEDLLPVDLSELSEKVVALENQLTSYKQIEKEYKELKEKLYEAMENNDIKKWTTNNGVQITRVDSKPDTEIEVSAYDEDKFIKENIELHQTYHNKLAEYKYIKKEIKKGRSGYVLITPPKDVA